MEVCVDRLEGGFAVLLDDAGGVRNVPLADLEAGVREGDILTCGVDGVYRRNAERTAERRAQIQRKMDALFE